MPNYVTRLHTETPAVAGPSYPPESTIARYPLVCVGDVRALLGRVRADAYTCLLVAIAMIAIVLSSRLIFYGWKLLVLRVQRPLPRCDPGSRIDGRIHLGARPPHRPIFRPVHYPNPDLIGFGLRHQSNAYPRGFLRQSLCINESPVHALYQELDRSAPDEDRHSALLGG